MAEDKDSDMFEPVQPAVEPVTDDHPGAGYVAYETRQRGETVIYNRQRPTQWIATKTTDVAPLER